MDNAKNTYMNIGKVNLFTWNDLVIIKTSVPSSYPEGQIAVICGMEQIKSEKLAKDFKLKMGDWIYTIEFGDGSSIEISEIYLEKY